MSDDRTRSLADRRYAVIPTPADRDPVWSAVPQKPDTARRSADGSCVLVEWLDTAPTAVSAAMLPTAAKTLALEEAQAMMQTPAWVNGAEVDVVAETASVLR